MDDRQRGGLQFERAASSAGDSAVSCGSCQRSIPDVYYEANGSVLCSACKDAALASLQGGSGLVRLASALALGSVAAAVSAAGWYAITALTGYEIGLVAVAVGLLVGGAVRAGSQGRGGWLYQLVALALTYLAIATSYVPPALAAFREQAAAAAEEPAAEGEQGLAEGELQAAPLDDGAVAAEEPLAVDPEWQEAAIWTAAIVFAFVWPVLQVTEGGFIGLLIVGFALYEAWKLNKRSSLALTGPFRIESRPAASRA